MSVATSKFMNEHRFEMEGEIDLSAAAAVTAYRGLGTAAKTAVGTYTVTIPGAIGQGLMVVELLKRAITFAGTVPAAATGCRIVSVVQSASDGSIVITIKTSASPTTGADTDTTAATTLSFSVVWRTQKMTAQL